MAKRIKRKVVDTSCPCKSGLDYAECCKPFHDGLKVVEDAERLLRTRYSAYALGLADYIMNTTDSEGSAWWHDAEAWRANTRQFANSATFEGFRVISSESQGDAHTIMFKAKISQKGKDISMVETSQFVFREGRWLYKSGVVH